MSTKVEPWPANRRNRLQLLTSAVRVKHDRVAGRCGVCHSSGGFVSGGNSTLQPTELPIACLSVSALWPGPNPHPRAPLARSLPDRVSRLVRGISPLGAEAGRGDWIRTSDLFVPNEARYQAAPRPDREPSMASSPRMLKQRRRPGRRPTPGGRRRVSDARPRSAAREWPPRSCRRRTRPFRPRRRWPRRTPPLESSLA
jgi:hypothetical protein